jgi:gluconolactonase
MPQPPYDVTAAVFATLPPALDLAADPPPSPWLADRPYHDQRPGSFLEGPAFDHTGRLYCVDIAYGRILRVGDTGALELFVAYEGAPNGLAIHRDGRLFVADHKRGLVVVDPASREVDVLLAGAFGEPFKGLNDLAFAANGDLYFTDQGQSGLDDPSGRVFRIAADGCVERVLDRIPSPNGLALAADGRSLMLAVTRANQIWRLPLAPDGRAYKVGVHLNLPGAGGPDGLALDAEGNLYVAMPTLGSVLVFDRHGDRIGRIRSGTQGRMLTNLAFGGRNNEELFITDSTTGSIQRIDLGRPSPAPELRT